MRRPDRGMIQATLLTRLLFIIAVALLAGRAIGNLVAPDPVHVVGALLMVSYLAELVPEARVTFGAPRDNAAESGTPLMYASARMLLVISAILPAAPWPGWSPWMLPLVLLFFTGIALRLGAIRALGTVYSHHVVRLEQHPLVTTGPYRLVRHPAYAGMLVANLGFILFFRNPASVAAWLVLLGALIWRIRTEERVLWSIPGYPEFATGRARLLVGVW